MAGMDTVAAVLLWAQVSRHKRTSPASDIFSFGVVAW